MLHHGPGGEDPEGLIESGSYVQCLAENVPAVVDGPCPHLRVDAGGEEKVMNGAGLMFADLAPVEFAGRRAVARDAGDAEGHLVDFPAREHLGMYAVGG